MIALPTLALLFSALLAGSPQAVNVPRATPDTTESVADTTRTYALDEVVVTGANPETALRKAPSPVSIVHVNAFESGPGSLLSEALDGIPGVVIREYGGGAAVRNASIRGMSAEHTLVLIDGQRLNSFENGTTDLGYLSTLGFDRLEIARGGWSAVYGSDAVGGVINIITQKPSQDIHAKVRQAFGTNNYSASEVAGDGGTDGVAIAAGLRQERGRGNYEFDFSDGLSTTRLRRTDDDFKILSGNLRVAADFSDAMKGNLLVLYAHADRGSPGPVTDAATSARARLNDQNVLAQSGINWELGSGWRGSLTGAWHYSLEHYSDPQLLLGGFPLRSFYDNRSVELHPEIQFVGSSSILGTAGIDLGYGSLSSSDVHSARRWTQSYVLNGQIRVRARMPLLDEILVYPSVRYDRFSDVRGDVSPRVGINLGVLEDPDLRLRASYGKSYRAPTFNELYWIAGGNPNLDPERSLSFDAGALSEIKIFGVLTLAATYFSIDTRDRIVWEPQSGGFWSPRNIARVTSRGVETEATWNGLNGFIEVGVAGTWTRATKMSEDFPGDPTFGRYLIDVPLQTLNVKTAFRLDPVSLIVQHSWVSYRYSTETNDRFLPHYSLTSVAARWVFALGNLTASVKLEVSNLFNASYQEIALFPMPMRELRGTVGVDL